MMDKSMLEDAWTGFVRVNGDNGNLLICCREVVSEYSIIAAVVYLDTDMVVFRTYLKFGLLPSVAGCNCDGLKNLPLNIFREYYREAGPAEIIALRNGFYAHCEDRLRYVDTVKWYASFERERRNQESERT